MFDLYDFIEQCKEDGLTSDEAMDKMDRILADMEQERIEAYENDPMVQYGWYQQDMIDMRRRER